MKKHVILLVCILFLAVMLRLYNLAQIPIAPYWEEAAIGYDAYSILQTGKDHHGNPYPLLAFRSFGDYKPPLYFYSVVPFVKLFGLNTVAVRFPSMLAGVGTVLVLFFIGQQIYSRKVGLIAALFYAIQPWSLHISHVGFETNLATFLLSLGVLCGLKARKNSWWLVLCAVCFGLSMYAYHSARIVGPLLGIVMVCYAVIRKTIGQYVKALIVAGCIAGAFALPIVINLRNPVIAQRAAETSIFSDISWVEESNALRAKDNGFIVGRLIHHRYAVLGSRVMKNMVKNFSWNFLFLQGDSNVRHQTSEFGLLYHWELPLLLIFVYAAIKKRSFAYLLPIVWIGAASIPPALTTVSPHTLRFFSASPAFALISSIGVAALLSSIKPRYRFIITMLCAGIIMLETTIFMHFYVTHYALISAKDWQYGYAQLYDILAKEKRMGEKVFVTREQGRPAMYLMFTQKLDPLYVQAQDKIVPKDQGEFLQLGEYYFVDGLPTDSGLFATTPSKRDPIQKPLFSITLPTGESIWDIWRRE